MTQKRKNFLAYAQEIRNLGYRVIINGDALWNYGYIINDKDEIGCFQLDDWGCGVRFSTMHYGTRTMGTGFGLDDSFNGHTKITKNIVDRCFVRVPAHCCAPGWCRTKEGRDDLERVKKYKGSDYIAMHWNKDKLVEL